MTVHGASLGALLARVNGASFVGGRLGASLIAGNLGDKAVPTNFVIDRKGVVRHAKAGAFSYDSFARLLNPLLAEARPVEVA